MGHFRATGHIIGITAFVIFGVFGASQYASAANTITSQQYVDSDFNGTVDRVELTFDTNLTACTYDAADWTVNTAGTVGITGITGFVGTCSGASPLLTITVTTKTTKTGGGTAPVISYANAGTANSLQDSGIISAKPSLTLTDGAKPIIRIVDLTDSNADGLVDEINFAWSEVVDTDDGSAPVAADLPTTLLPDGATANFGAATISDPAGASQVVTVSGVTGQGTINTGIGSTAISGDLSTKWKDANANTPHATGATGNETVTEIMAPLVVSSTPASGAGGVVRTSNMTLTFSESIGSMTWSISPNVTLTNATSLPASAITLTGIKLSGTNTFTILTAVDTNLNDFGEFMSTGTSAITFVVAESEDEEQSASPTYDIAVTSPTASSALTAGQSTTITWSTAESTGTIGAVNLEYSTDSGDTWNTIVSNTSNDGSYVWDIPSDIDSDAVVLYVEGTDLVTVLATDTSDVFAVSAATSGEDTTSDDGMPEETSGAYEGQYIRGESWTTVYVVEGNMRRPFLDSQTFFTYETSFANVVTVSDSVLADYTIGTPMLPNPGVVLIKIQSVEKVYVLTGENTLRWIDSEATAIEMFGSNWADYVIDVPVTAWGHFTIGETINDASDITVDHDIMKTREEVNA